MLLAAMALMASAGAAAPAPSQLAMCQNTDPRMVDDAPADPSGKPPFRHLDELPPANLVLTVVRIEDGCVTPVVVRYGIGAPARPDK